MRKIACSNNSRWVSDDFACRFLTSEVTRAGRGSLIIVSAVFTVCCSQFSSDLVAETNQTARRAQTQCPLSGTVSDMWQDQSPQLRKDVLTLLSLFYLNIVSHRFWEIESWGNLWLMGILSMVRRFDNHYYLHSFSNNNLWFNNNDCCSSYGVQNWKKKRGKQLQPAARYKFAINIFSASSMFSFLR